MPAGGGARVACNPRRHLAADMRAYAAERQIVEEEDINIYMGVRPKFV